MIKDIQEIGQFLIGYGFEGLIAGLVVFFLLKFFLPGYLSEKGKNLATREDIASITDEIERVRAQYSIVLEELKNKNQLRLAAIDRRLEAHQEAFVLWRKLISYAHTDEIGKVVLECQDWWEKNCLYLEPAVRESFSDSYSAAHTHNVLLQNRNDSERVQENWNRIIKSGDIILQAAQLPALTALEKEIIDKTK